MVYKILSYLLFYPDSKYLANLTEVLNSLDSCVLEAKAKENIKTFIKAVLKEDKYDLMTNYVKYFDRNPSLSLYMFDHIMGEDKEKGEALSNLKELYQRNNFDLINSKDLPDYIPLFLEFVSCLDSEKAKETVLETYNLMNNLYLKHKKLDSIYALVFESIIISMGKEAKNEEVSVLNDKNIDEIWQEQEIVFSGK